MFGTIIVGAAVVAIIAVIVISNIKGKKKGGSSCGCGCSGCAMSSICHKGKAKKDGHVDS